MSGVDSNESRIGRNTPERWSLCLLLTMAALFVHGYHPFAEDAGIYVPAIKKLLDPSLYPTGAEFFLLPSHWSIFANAVALSARASHLPLPYVLLFWYVACLFFVIAASWKIAEICFGNWYSGFIAATLIAVTASMPAAGCSLLLVDPYLTARSFSTPLLLFSVAFILRKRNKLALGCWAAAVLFHPLMALIGGVFLMLLIVVRRERRYVSLLSLIATGMLALFAYIQISHLQMSADYRSAVATRSYFFLSGWTWYEILGALAPLAMFAWMASRGRERQESLLFQVSWAAAVFGILAMIAALAVLWVPWLFPVARFQPMRAFQLIYILWLVVPVNWGLQWLSRGWQRRTREIAFAGFVVVLGGFLYLSQAQTFRSSSHVEWPWRSPRNSWLQAFEWIRLNTPIDAVFALDPDYANDAGNDRQGFRATAERSALPDRAKDGGVAALFPQLAKEWDSSVRLSSAVNRLGDDQRSELLAAGVTWVVVRAEKSSLLDCPYSNDRVAVCRLIAPPRSARLKPAASENR